MEGEAAQVGGFPLSGARRPCRRVPGDSTRAAPASTR